MSGYPKAEGEDQIRRELSRLKRGEGGGGGGMQEHDEEFHLKYIGPHNFLREVTAYDHHGHADEEVKTWNGTDTTWTLAYIPKHGVQLYWKPDGGSYLLMDPEADYTLVGAVITPTNKPTNLDKTRVASYEYATG